MSDILLSGFVGVAIDVAIKETLRHINIAIRCRKELESLNQLLLTLGDINSAMQKYRRALNSGQVNSSQEFIPSCVNDWFRKLGMLLQEASEIAQQCTVPTFDFISRYKMGKKIAGIISSINEHRKQETSIGITLQLAQLVNFLEISTTEIPASSSSAAPLTEGLKYIGEPLIVGQDKGFDRLEELLQKSSRIGVVGMGGTGKTLLLKRLFNCDKVQHLFANGLLLWLTVSQTPSLTGLRNDLGTQIAFKINENFNQKLREDDIKIWLNRKMSEKKFALFLDDVWDRSANLLEELGVPLPTVSTSNCDSSVVIVSSRNKGAVLEMGAATSSTVTLQRLMEDDSWHLFLSHAFRHSNGKIPAAINEETAMGVCRECGGLPLALKVIGRAMASITQSAGWEIRLKKLQNAEPIKDGDVADSLYGRLRLSYDALADLDVSLQMCFLYLAAYAEDQVIFTGYVSNIWVGEGLLAAQSHLQVGQAYVDLLADRCLIEPIQKDIDGYVVHFRVHDVLQNLARQIAQKEENCFFLAGRGLQEFPVNECSGHLRISLMENRLRCVPHTYRAPQIRSLLLSGNPDLKEIPKQVIQSMTSLRVLDLTGTAVLSLPESLGHLKHLVSLTLMDVPITRLPHSITSLKKLQVLDLYNSHIRELPSNIHKLTSLTFLDLSFCENLGYLPHGISQLKSLEFFSVLHSPNVWLKIGQNKGKRNPLVINDLGALKQLKILQLLNNGETMDEGTLGSMTQMESVYLRLTNMESLPHDMTAMSKLRKIWFECPQLIKMEHTICGFQHLNYIKFYGCRMLKQLPDLHKLPRLEKLDIAGCTNIKNLPKEFGERGAFPMLETFSLVQLGKLEELPMVEEGAMPSLKTFSLVLCEALQIVPESYWNLKTLNKINVYGCSTVLNKMQEDPILKSTKVQTVTMSAVDTIASMKRIKKIVENKEHRLYGEFWSNDLFQILYNTLYFIVD